MSYLLETAQRAAPLHVDFERNAWDKRARLLAREGLYAQTIADATGLTVSQVRYRVQKAGLGRDYRRGKGAEGELALARVDRLLAMCRHLRHEFREARGKQ